MFPPANNEGNLGLRQRLRGSLFFFCFVFVFAEQFSVYRFGHVTSLPSLNVLNWTGEQRLTTTTTPAREGGGTKHANG